MVSVDTTPGQWQRRRPGASDVVCWVSACVSLASMVSRVCCCLTFVDAVRRNLWSTAACRRRRTITRAAARRCRPIRAAPSLAPSSSASGNATAPRKNPATHRPARRVRRPPDRRPVRADRAPIRRRGPHRSRPFLNVCAAAAVRLPPTRRQLSTALPPRRNRMRPKGTPVTWKHAWTSG